MGIFNGEKEVVVDSYNTSFTALKCPDRFHINLGDCTFCVYPILINTNEINGVSLRGTK